MTDRPTCTSTGEGFTRIQDPLGILRIQDPLVVDVVTDRPTCTSTDVRGSAPTHAANWAKLPQEVLTVQSSSTRQTAPTLLKLLLLLLLLLLLRLKASGAGAARPESTSCLLGSRALRSSRPWTVNT